MYRLREFIIRVRNIFRQTQLDADLREQLDTHRSMVEADLIERGIEPSAAARSARHALGNALLVQEFSRDQMVHRAVDEFSRNVRRVFRQLRRNPEFTLIAVCTLTFGLAATLLMFSIINSVLLEPLKYRDPDRLYAVVNISPPQMSSRVWPVNMRHFHDWRAHCRSCEDIAIGEGVGFILSGSGEPERFSGLRVSYNFFRTFGVAPFLGRDFLPQEELPAQANQVILAYSLWKSRFARDPNIIGRVLQLNGTPHTVIGVMPEDFHLPTGSQWGTQSGPPFQPAIFRPLGQDASQARPFGALNFLAIVRLKPEIFPAQTSAELDSLIASYVREFNIVLKPLLIPLHETVTRQARAGLWLLLTTVSAVLLIVCVNIGNLMLVRTVSRDREIGIRLALGSSRGQLFKLVLTEALVLVLTGSVLGIALAYAGLELFIASAPIDLPRMSDIHMGSRVVVFGVATAAISTLICGFFPALRVSRGDPHQKLQTTSAKTTPHGRTRLLREAMVGVEVGLSTVLLVVGGLLLLSFIRVINVDKGFEPVNVLTQDVSISNPQYRDADRVRLLDQALERLSGIPGVQSAGVTNRLPLKGESWICDLRDMGPPAKAEVGLANFRFVSSGYWRTLGISLKKGRVLEPADHHRRNVAVISERVADLVWPGQDPLGRRIGGCGIQSTQEGLEVVGVVGDVRAGLEQAAPLTIYQPYSNIAMSTGSFVIRTDAHPVSVVPAIRSALRSIDANIALLPTTAMEQIFDEAVAVRRFQMRIAVALAISALLIASFGIYGIVSFTVARRTSELGIRIALGAHARRLAVRVLLQGMLPVIAGLVLGLVVALLTGRFIATQLYGVSPTDPFAIASISLLLLAVSAFACWIPARRAMRIDPSMALRFE